MGAIRYTGNVVVTALDCLGLAETNLPGCWSFAGGNAVGLGLLQRQISKANCGSTTFICSAGSSSKTNIINVVQFNGLSVSGAMNVGTSNDWVAVKTNGDYVTITASFCPNDTNAAALLHWRGGTPAPGNPLQVTVPKASSGVIKVTASCCNTSVAVKVWIIWSTISYQFTDTTPPNAQMLWTNLNPNSSDPNWLKSHLMWYEPGFDLGVQFYTNMTNYAYQVPGTWAYAKECTIATIDLTPIAGQIISRVLPLV